jgi:hypothetical protein
VFIAGLSPLEVSALKLNLGFSGRVGRLYPVSEAKVQAWMFAHPKLPYAFVVKVPSTSLLLDRARQTCPKAVAQLVSRAPIVGSVLTSDAEVVEIGRKLTAKRARAVYPPKRCLMIGSVVKEPEVVEIRTNSPGVDVPRSGLAQDLESVKALPNIGSLANRNQAAGTIVQLLSSDSERNPVLLSSEANVQESGLKVEPLLINRPRAALTERFDSTLQLDKRAKVFAVVDIDVSHIPLEKERVLDCLLAPVIVSDPLEV